MGNVHTVQYTEGHTMCAECRQWETELDTEQEQEDPAVRVHEDAQLRRISVQP